MKIALNKKRSMNDVIPNEPRYKDIRDKMAPNKITVNPTNIKLGDNFSKTLVIIDYPNKVEPNWLQGLYRFKGNINISYHLKPASAENMIKSLSRSITELKIRLTQTGRAEDSIMETENELESARALLKKLIGEKNDHIFLFHMYVNLQAESEEKLLKLEKDIRKALIRAGLKDHVPEDQMLEAMQSALPIGQNKLSQWTYQNMDAEAVASTFLFDEAEIFEKSGMLKGSNKTTDSLVLTDQTKLKNKNEFLIGMSGAGKTFYMKVDMLRHFMQGFKIYVIDHEGEYSKMIKKIGGQVIMISPMSGSVINPMEIMNAYSVKPIQDGEEEDFEEFDNPSLLHQKISRLKIFFKLIKKDMTPLEQALLEDIVVDTYRDKGIVWETDFTKLTSEDYPILEDLYKKGEERNDDRLVDFLAILKTYVHGSNSLIFNGPTNVNLKNDAISFNMKHLEDESDIHQSAMYNILSFLFDEITLNLVQKRLYVDEAHIMADPDNPRAMKFLFQVFKRIRKYNGGCTAGTQQIADFFSAVEGQKNYGKAVIGNSMSKMILSLEDTDITDLKKFDAIKLSEQEEKILRKAKQGEGIYIVGDKRVHIEVKATPAELKIIDPDQYKKVYGKVG